MLEVVAHADRVCGWLENLTDKDTPPRWMWTVPHEYQRWFENIKAKREAEADGRSNPDDDEEDVDEELERKLRGR